MDFYRFQSSKQKNSGKYHCPVYPVVPYFGDCAYFLAGSKNCTANPYPPAHANDRAGEVMCMELSLKLDFLRMYVNCIEHIFRVFSYLIRLILFCTKILNILKQILYKKILRNSNCFSYGLKHLPTFNCLSVNVQYCTYLYKDQDRQKVFFQIQMVGNNEDINSVMIFQVVAECTLKESAAINQILGNQSFHI
jgi:hypothetical protein